MRYVNILWPSRLEAEYKALFAEFCDIADEAGLDEQNFSEEVNKYIKEHASKKLKDWLEELKEMENQPA